jgi:hypothetical protein
VLQTNLPLRGKATSWTDRVVVQRDVRVHGLIGNSEGPARAASERYDPALPGRLRPVSVHRWGRNEIPTTRQVVGNGGLDLDLIH